MLQKCIQISLPREKKEVHFWDWHHRKGFQWYVNQFSYPPGSEPKPYYGEITPCYAVLPPATIAEISNCFPELKIIFVARDMVERAWSAMIMELRDQTMGLQAGEFAKGAIPGGAFKRAKTDDADTKISVAQQRRLQQQSTPSSQSDSYYVDRLRSETHSSRSDYATHLKNWFAYYPSENILILDYREIEKDPRAVLLKIVMHIGVDEKEATRYVDEISDDEAKQKVNVATNTSTTDGSSAALSQRPFLRKQMQNLLRPYAKAFNALLEEHGYKWKLNIYS